MIIGRLFGQNDVWQLEWPVMNVLDVEIELGLGKGK
jgi:hypothetical protein